VSSDVNAAIDSESKQEVAIKIMKEEGASVAGYATRAPSPAIDGKHELSEF